MIAKKSPDITGACWRCGTIEHVMNDCMKADDNCLACEILKWQDFSRLVTSQAQEPVPES